jgi:hypothetical protein
MAESEGQLDGTLQIARCLVLDESRNLCLTTKLSVTPQQTPENRNLRLVLPKKINSINARYSAVLGCEQGLKWARDSKSECKNRKGEKE